MNVYQSEDKSVPMAEKFSCMCECSQPKQEPLSMLSENENRPAGLASVNRTASTKHATSNHEKIPQKNGTLA